MDASLVTCGRGDTGHRAGQPATPTRRIRPGQDKEGRLMSMITDLAGTELIIAGLQQS